MRPPTGADYAQRAAAMVAEVAPGFTWPGGYPLALLMADGAAVCPSCAVDNAQAIAAAEPSDSWRAEGAFIHWEGPPLICAECGASVESAYGDPEGES